MHISYIVRDLNRYMAKTSIIILQCIAEKVATSRIDKKLTENVSALGTIDKSCQ